MTFAYFYPRNEIMFRAAQLNDVTLLRETWASWSAMNWVRSSILLAGVILSCESTNTDRMLTVEGQLQMAQWAQEQLKLRQIKPEWLTAVSENQDAK